MKSAIFAVILALTSATVMAASTENKCVQAGWVPFTTDEYTIDNLLQMASVAQPAQAQEIYDLLALKWNYAAGKL